MLFDAGLDRAKEVGIQQEQIPGQIPGQIQGKGRREEGIQLLFHPRNRK